MQAPSRQRDLAMAHEQSHLQARDPQLLAVAYALVVIMPWNLPLWWLLRRLRCAIEIDCDLRVLRGGGDLLDYGETLIELSQHQYRHAGLMAATTHSQSFLERRIRIMSTQPHRWSRVAAGTLTCLALGVVAVAAAMTPPTLPAALAVPATRATQPARPAAPALPPQPALPALPALAALPPKSPAQATESDDVDDRDEAKVEAESAAEQADEAKSEAEEAEMEAHEAMREADDQMEQATAAKREAEAAEVQAHARKLEAEEAARAAHAARQPAR